MKAFKVVGFRPYSGEYEGRKYSGYFVHAVTDGADRGVTGERVQEIKVKSKLGYTPCVGDQIFINYDEFGISEIKLFDE